MIRSTPLLFRLVPLLLAGREVIHLFHPHLRRKHPINGGREQVLFRCRVRIRVRHQRELLLIFLFQERQTINFSYPLVIQRGHSTRVIPVALDLFQGNYRSSQVSLIPAAQDWPTRTLIMFKPQMVVTTSMMVTGSSRGTFQLLRQDNQLQGCQKRRLKEGIRHGRKIRQVSI